MFELFSGEQVADLCEDLAELARDKPITAWVTGTKLARMIRAGLMDRPAARAALLAALAK